LNFKEEFSECISLGKKVGIIIGSILGGLLLLGLVIFLIVFMRRNKSGIDIELNSIIQLTFLFFWFILATSR